ncbi:hypothetical protein LshimejAT787_0902820 [Lyophyllum shimeji]|uniref:Uncharacterized protein n=1 Tax=Lyophyllum shimeji TaxID=47721 RepID=A0A9P3UQ98_LYOSH|nr:hypothetical protein LshimejAT787_0902820 [Lyophyllum shimeji]
MGSTTFEQCQLQKRRSCTRRTRPSSLATQSNAGRRYWLVDIFNNTCNEVPYGNDNPFHLCHQADQLLFSRYRTVFTATDALVAMLYLTGLPWNGPRAA